MASSIAAHAVILKNQSPNGELVQATFLPDYGMNLVSYKRGDIEAIDQATWPLFEERFAGLGALIGPHFHRRHPATLPRIPDETLFPHIDRVKKKGVADPFSHGIARYAPWKVVATDTEIHGVLSGNDMWNGVPLAKLEGQNFKMNFHAELLSTSLSIDLDVVSDADSLVGIHYYYSLPKNSGKVMSQVQTHFISHEGLQPLPSTWQLDSQRLLTFDLSQEADFTFYPFPNPTEGHIILDTGESQIITSYSSPSQENCWQLYHPKNASFVCIEPISAQDPRHPNLSASCIHISIEIRKLS